MSDSNPLVERMQRAIATTEHKISKEVITEEGVTYPTIKPSPEKAKWPEALYKLLKNAKNTAPK